MKLDSNSVAVVTGAGSGLGRALCLELARRGAKVMVSDVNGATAEETAGLVRSQGGAARAMRCDVTDASQVEALAVETEAAFAAPTLVVNNAGVSATGPVGEIPLADWAWTVNVNLWGVIHGCHVFVPRLKQTRGHLLNVASIAAYAATSFMAPYNVTKAGVVALSETLAMELDRHQVGVTVLCPYFFRTGILDAGRVTGADPRLMAAAAKAMDSAKMQAPEVARAALDACEAGRLYCFPQREAKLLWALKRVAGEGFRSALRRVMPRG